MSDAVCLTDERQTRAAMRAVGLPERHDPNASAVAFTLPDKEACTAWIATHTQDAHTYSVLGPAPFAGRWVAVVDLDPAGF